MKKLDQLKIMKVANSPSSGGGSDITQVRTYGALNVLWTFCKFQGTNCVVGMDSVTDSVGGTTGPGTGGHACFQDN